MNVALHPNLISKADHAAATAAAVASLRRAADRIEQPNAWTQHAAARNAAGEPVGYADPTAVQWCLTGAMRLETHNESLATRIIADKALADTTKPAANSAAYNDVANSAAHVASVARMAAASLEADANSAVHTA